MNHLYGLCLETGVARTEAYGNLFQGQKNDKKRVLEVSLIQHPA